MNMIIVQEGHVVAVIKNWEGPVPRQGDYLYHPAQGDHGQPAVNGQIAGCVRQVVWGLHGRSPAVQGHFTTAADPFVEVVI